MNSQSAPEDFCEPLVLLTDGELSAREFERSVEAALQGGAGATVIFVGIVRDNSRGPDGMRHQIRYLEYSAYAPMALREMQKISAAVRQQWNLPCAIGHRLGQLGIGEASVVVAVASPHRAAAFEACHWAIDEVKAKVPIWKKEMAVDGVWWVDDPLASGETRTEATLSR